MLFAIKFYDNPQAVTKEDFEDDLKRIKYIKRLLELRVHLILNHLTVLFNVFDEAAVPLLFYNLEEDLWSYLKSFLIFLNRLSEYPQTEINLIKEDQKCLSLLHEV